MAHTNEQGPVGRLAPSPTGAQHLGNARTYLLAWLSVRNRGGKIVLRIEDIDSPRVKAGAAEQSLDDLHWLGLDWDEGPRRGGPRGPYVQTERTQHYEAALNRLCSAGHCYPCVCSRKDIARAASAPQQGDGAPLYPGTCAAWRLHDAIPAVPFCWRMRSRNAHTEFVDRLAGRQRLHHAEALGDFPITRKGGAAAYHLAVVVDDALMGVTEVVRGNDLIPSTFHHLAIQEALGYPRPEYIHVGLVRGEDGRRLAKRHGDSRLDAYRQRGVAPERIVGLLAWSAGLLDTRRPIAPAELVDRFRWTPAAARDWVFDRDAEAWLLADGE